MKNAIAVFFLSVSLAQAVPVFYDTATRDVKGWGQIDPVKYVADNPGLGYIVVADNDPLLLKDVEFIKVNAGLTALALKSQSTIDAIKQDRKNIANSDAIEELQEKITNLNSLLSSTTNQVLIDKWTLKKAIFEDKVNKLKGDIQ